MLAAIQRMTALASITSAVPPSPTRRANERTVSARSPRGRVVRFTLTAGVALIACGACEGPPNGRGPHVSARDGSARPSLDGVSDDGGAPTDAGAHDGEPGDDTGAHDRERSDDGGELTDAGPLTGADAAAEPSPSPAYAFDGVSRLNGLPRTRCTVTVTSAELSTEIPTVGIVHFSSDLAELSSAEIEFGPDTRYGLVAPVDLGEPGYRTLLLGMIEDATYHYRVAVSNGSSVCYGEDQTLTTGSLNTAALSEATTSRGAAPGFMVTSRDGTAVIYDKLGRLVWAYDMWNVFAVHLSWDGKYLIGRDPGPFDLGEGGTFYRVAMDGTGFTELDAPGGDHHDFAVLPEGVAYLAKPSEGDCDWVYEASVDLSDGAPVFDTWQVFQHFSNEGMLEGSERCHANRLHYSPEKDRYSVSDRNKDALAVFTRDGTPLFSIGKPPSGDWADHVLAEGAGVGGDWHVQHGHDLYADDAFVVFTNESQSGAAALHYSLHGNQASLDWKYTGAGASKIQGDVQRLPNGNFLVTANLSGTIVELSPDGRTELGRYVLGGAIGPLYGFGYCDHRPSLYAAIE